MKTFKNILTKNPKISARFFDESLKRDWDEVLGKSENGTLMHSREYLSYHGDKFQDCSILLYKGTQAVAIFPAHAEGQTILSHKGLGYAGLVFIKKLSFDQKLQAYRALFEAYYQHQFDDIVIRVTPAVYGPEYAETHLYLLYLAGGQTIKNELSLAIPLPLNPKNLSKGRKSAIKSAEGAGLSLMETVDFGRFWEELLIPNLANRHGVEPVHNSREIAYLAKRNPGNIRQFVVAQNGEWLAGATVYVTPTCAHTQYLASNEAGRKHHALDYLIKGLCEGYFKDKEFLDFGHVNEKDGQLINRGLLRWKQSFGAKPHVLHHIKVKTTAWQLLMDRYA